MVHYNETANAPHQNSFESLPRFIVIVYCQSMRAAFRNRAQWTSAPTTFDWHIKMMLDYQAINCVLDVGANRGQFAERLRRLGYRGWIVSFEPVPEAYQRLSHRFRNDERWRGFQIALGDRDEVRPFHIAAGDAQASSFLE